MTTSFDSTARNSVFILTEKALKMGTYLLAGVVIARLAGPEIFGLYSSYLATSVIFTVFAALGLNTLLVKELILSQSPRQVISNALLLRVQAAAISGLGLLLAMLCFIQASLTTSLLAVSLIFVATFQIADCFFEARQQMGSVLKYKALGYLSGLVLKVAVAFYLPDPTALLAAHLLEMLVIFSGAAFSVWRRVGQPRTTELDAQYRTKLFKRGLPLFLSSLAVVVYMKVDLSMVLRLSGAQDAGIYAAATRLCEAIFILSAPIIVASFPRLLSLFNEDQQAYQGLMRQTFWLLAGSGIVLAGTAYVLAEFAVMILYGPEFSESAKVIRIYALSLPVIFVGDLLSRWLIISENLNLSIQRHILGLIVNVGLNLYFIPKLGPEGAAIASVCGYLSAIILFSLLHPKARPFYSFLRPL